jgi:lipid II:glycine glycyltransferase (peptidoglycan interpeptide bridge formation enzyme)
LNARDAAPHELADWDAWTVDAPGGHVYQSLAWANHRRSSGWRTRFLIADDGGRILALTRPWRFLPGGSAYIPRGPAGGAPDVVALADRQIAVAERLSRDDIDVVAADPEVPADRSAFRSAIAAAGFEPIEEIQPSRNRVTLPLHGADEAAAFDAVTKSTRQRIRAAERDSVRVTRFDRRESGGAEEGFDPPSEPVGAALARFYTLLLETGERRHFTFGPRGSFVAWWQAAHDAGHLILLEARPPAEPGPVAGLVLYRHGGRLSTVHSADHAATRRDHPGLLHLLRWRAIQLAIREGCTELDLGGVDVAGARGEPHEGDPLYGLYQHKRAFGGRWLELTGAHQRVFDAPGYAAGRVADRIARMARRGGR